MKQKKIQMILLVCLITLIFGFAKGEALAAGRPYEKICTKEEWEVLKRTNKERLKEGLEPFSTFRALQEAGDVRGKEILSYFSHIRPNGTSCFTALNGIGYYYTMGENIAAGYDTAESVMSSWMKSPGHRENILNEAFVHMGTGYEKGGKYGTGWVQLFIGDCDFEKIQMDESAKKEYEAGTTIDAMERYLVVVCKHGISYLPVTEEMCSGYNPDKNGTQTIKVTYQGMSTSFQVRIGKESSVAKVTGTKVKRSGKKGAVVTWKKVKNASGYEIYMKNGNGPYKKIKNIKGGSKIRYIKKGLKKGKKYTFKVRAYKKEGNKKITGPFGAGKSIKP